MIILVMLAENICEYIPIYKWWFDKVNDKVDVAVASCQLF